MEWVQHKVEARVATITMNRIEKRNALSPQLIQELHQTIGDLNQREDIKVIVLKSNAPAFSAGADLGYIQEMRDFSYDENIADTRRLKDLFEEIYQSPKITISQVEGPALAGGCGLATIVDFCFATQESTFGYTEARIGFVPALVMVYLRHKLSFNKQTEWLLTGGVFSAKKALEDGLIYRVCEHPITEEVDGFVQQLISGVSAESVARTKFMMRQLPADHTEALEFAARNNAEARKSNDCIKGIDSFLRKEKIQW